MSNPLPIAFMVMPFGKKPTGLDASEGPTEVDFDALYSRVYEPVIRELGYDPVRADQDVGGIIVLEMLERLAVSDVVVVDVSIGNANVYYELGVRHAARKTHCALAAANWAKPLFDVQQVPRATFPLPDGSVPAPDVAAAQADLRAKLPKLFEGMSPIHQTLPDFPDVDEKSVRVVQLRAELRALQALMGKIRGVEGIADKTARRTAAEALRDELAPAGNDVVLRYGVWNRVMEMLRDSVGWEAVTAWIARMPAPLRARPRIEEQRLLALAKSGDAQTAIGALQELIDRAGGTSERWGLLGGRYKKLSRAVQSPDEAESYRDEAIIAYDKGMRADLNDYYPSCNLPQLYRERGEPGDQHRATEAYVIAFAAAQRSLARTPDDAWVRPTLLGLAFDAEDPAQAQSLLQQARSELKRLGLWQLDSTLNDLEARVRNVKDPVVRKELEAVAAGFRKLMGGGS